MEFQIPAAVIEKAALGDGPPTRPCSEQPSGCAASAFANDEQPAAAGDKQEAGDAITGDGQESISGGDVKTTEHPAENIDILGIFWVIMI